MLPSKPHGEDPTNGVRGTPVPFESSGAPPGEDGISRAGLVKSDEIENRAANTGLPEDEDGDPEEIDFLKLVREAEEQALLYMGQVNRRAWTQSLRAFHNEHFVGSKYMRPEWRNRSKFFVPKTRSAVRKDSAALAASLFGTVDAISCQPGDESDPRQRASASIVQQLVNYRTNRTSGRAALPWFHITMGARMDSVIHGICLSKQSWKLELKHSETRKVTRENGEQVTEEAYTPVFDRPDSQLIPPENFVIDPAADWTNPAQTAAYIIIKWPMRVDEIKKKQKSPLNPWNEIDEEVLRTSLENGKFDMAAIRRARESGLDRLDETQTGYEFQIVWVYETFMRVEGQDYTFISVGDKDYLTDPKPVEEVYPEQFGERPLTLGYGSLESHRIFPMAPVESWQMGQGQLNDLRNLTLDAVKQNVMPVSKVVRGKQVDLDQVRKRASGSSILVSNKDDVTWDRPPDIPQSVPMMTRELELELDDLAGQFNGGTAENNNALSRTLGGLKLVSGAANSVQEYDIRVWLETWCEPALAQIVRLEQYYEHDPIVLGICGQRAQLFQKYGINKIDDELLEAQVSISVSAGLGAGDPQQRLAKFTSAAQIVSPLLAQTKEFQTGEVEIDWEAVVAEVFGAAGYRDGGQRFFKKGAPKPPNPMQDLAAQKIQSEIEKNKATGKSALLTGLAAVGKAQLGQHELEADTVDMLLGHKANAQDMGHQHGHRHNEMHLSALDHGHRHGLAIAGHRRGIVEGDRSHELARRSAASEGGDSGGGEDAAPPSPPPQPEQQAQAPQAPVRFDFIRKGGRIVAAVPVYGPEPKQPVQSQPPPHGGGKEVPARAPEPEPAMLSRLGELLNEIRKPQHVLRSSAGEIIGVERR